MTMIRISPKLSLPLAFVTQTAAVIARKGGGKTYLAQKLAEQMLGAGAQVIVCDPVGNWYGLRLKADGRTDSGLPVYIFGGEYADIPITVDSGREIARLLATKPISAVLDVSRFRKGERERFMTAFAEEFFHLKKTHRSPVHLFIEEAQVFVPQMTQGRGPETAKMLGAFEDIVRLGRNYGIGCTMISQRPQSVNKQVLSQTECLFALQITGPHERKAIDEWVTEHGVDRKLVGELPSLQQGEAFFWSPGWLRIFERIRIEPKTTYDASSTPEVGAKAAKPVELSTKEIEQLGSELKQSVERAKSEDPRELKKQIVELRAELAKRAPAVPAPVVDKAATEKAVNAAIARTRRDIEKAYAPLVKLVTTFVEKAAGAIPAAIEYEIDNIPAPGWMPIEDMVASKVQQEMARSEVPLRRPDPHANGSAGDSKLGRAERAILQAIAQRHPAPSTRGQISRLSGYSIKSSSFSNALSALRTANLIDGYSDEVRATDAGLKTAGPLPPVPSGKALFTFWSQKLEKAERIMLDVIIRHGGKGVDRETLSAESGYSITSSSFSNALSALRTLELIEGKNHLLASAEFFQ